MKRIDILYGGIQYSVGERDLDELQARIAESIQSERPTWLEVNHGEGRPQPAFLLITAGVSVALIPAATDG